MIDGHFDVLSGTLNSSIPYHTLIKETNHFFISPIFPGLLMSVK